MFPLSRLSGVDMTLKTTPQALLLLLGCQKCNKCVVDLATSGPDTLAQLKRSS